MTTDPTVHFCGLTHCEGPSHTWVNGAKAYTCHGPNTERRDRYAAAMDECRTLIPTALADAAMAVADDEQRKHVEATKYWFDAADERREEIARLRAELVYAQAKRDDNWRYVERLRAENKEFRKVLAETESRLRSAVLRDAADEIARDYGAAAVRLRRMADEAQQTEPRCTCADAGPEFAPAGHYTDCPQNAEEPRS
jgi:chromosome segregation ATPase